MTEGADRDFAVAAYVDDGRWDVVRLPPRALSDLDALVAALRQLGAEGVALALACVADDFLVAVRLAGSRARLLLSDAGAAEEDDLAQDVLEEVDPDGLAEDDGPAGDLGIFADLGLPAFEVGALCEDLDLYPDEVLARIAAGLGFADQLERAVAAR